MEDAGLSVMKSNEDKNEKIGRGGVTELHKVSSLTYLGTTIDGDGGWGKEIMNMIETVWNIWREMAGGLCGKKIIPISRYC